MKKVLTILAAVVMLASVSFAQQNDRRLTEKDIAGMSAAELFKAQQHKPVVMTTTNPTSAPKNVTSFPWTESFDATTLPAGFTTIDADADGYNWDCTYWNINGGQVTSSYTHSGNGMIASASYINNVGVLTPDNWLILPAMDIPAGSEFTLTWYEADYSYQESYTVYITTAGNTTTDFLAGSTTSFSTNESDVVFVKRTIDLSSYAGQTIYIAFRHYNVSDNYWLFIDDMRIGGPELPEISVDGPTIALMNQSVTYTATTAVSSVTWYVDGVAESTTALTLTTSFATAGLHEIVAEATNSAGSTYDTLEVNVVDCGTGINTFPFSENFEETNPCWLFVSADPANDGRVGIGMDNNHYQGTACFRFSSYGSASDYNQFLITPEITLPSDGNTYMVKFWYMGNNASDAFRVRVSTTTNDTAAFTTLLADNPTVPTEWTETAYILPAGTKYIAINYYGNYAYYLYIDSLTIEQLTAPVVTLAGPTTVGTGINATFTVSSILADTVAWYVDGTEVTATGDEYRTTFTTVGTHEVVVEATNTVGSSYDTIEVDVFSCDGYTAPYAPDFSTMFGCWVNRSDSTESGWFLSVDMFESDPEGQVLSMSAQNSFFGMYDFPVDNWLTSPVVALPAGNNYELAWKVKPYSTTYAGDHYGVYLIGDGQPTLLFEETLNENMTDYVQRAVALPTDVSSVKIAFRHFNSAGGYVIILDDIQFRNLTAPVVTLDGPTVVELNSEATFTAASGSADSYAWTVDGNAVTATGNTMSYTFTTLGNHTVAVAATNAAGTSNASLTVNVFTCEHITTFPFSEDFEAANVDCWTFVDADGDGYGWDVTNFNTTGNGNNGSDMAIVSASYINNLGALTPDNWMILPAIELPAGSNFYLNWYAKGQDASYAAENYSVYISTTGGNVSDFGTAAFTEETSGEWAGHTINLAQYAGQTIYVAFRHHDVTDMFYLDIDDISISGTAVNAIENVNDVNVNIYPNPVSSVLRVEGEGIEQVEVIDVNGRVVMNTKGGSINVSSLADGVYMVRVVTESGVSTQKIVKK